MMMASNEQGPVVDPQNQTGNVAAVLLAHARWADMDVLGACAPLSDAQLDRAFEIGPGSLRATVTEIIAAMRSWGDIYAGRRDRVWMPEEGPFTIDQLIAIAHEQHDDWADITARFSLVGVIERERAGRTYQYSRAQILTHVFTHSVHHRAQAINMLRHLTGLPAAGVGEGPSLPSGSAISWARSLA